MEKKKTNIKTLTEDFWALSRQRQEGFLRALYDLSAENKDMFKIWLAKENDVVATSLIKTIQKETINRIGKYKKLRLAKLNEILRNSEKYSFPILTKMTLKREVWMGMLAFLIAQSFTRYTPERYQVACARHLDQYIMMVRHHVLEPAEQEKMLTEVQTYLFGLLEKGIYLPHIEDVYMKNFVAKG